eukprot:scaffold18.g1969.t1
MASVGADTRAGACAASCSTNSQRRAVARPGGSHPAAKLQEQPQAPEYVPQVADAEVMLEELDACGVGLIASLKNEHRHDIIEKHRGACSADDVSGDGAGIMSRIPWALLREEVPGINDASTGVVGPVAIKTMPRFRQVFVDRPDLSGDELERELFIVRKLVEKAKAAELGDDHFDFYTCTLSNRTITYKGMLNSSAVGPFYKDLRDPRFVTPFAIYHRRFSTNTTPKWPLAQPMRVLGHNGEINTLQGNLNWVASRERGLRNEIWRGREADFIPLCSAAQSDSANLDHLAELMVRTGVDPQEALMILVPEAYRNHPDLQKAYPEVGARLDRNGLRPARFWQTDDGMVYVASEVGVLGDVLTAAGNVTAKGRLGPGQMVCADLEAGTFHTNTEIAKEVATRQPYKDWLKDSAQRLGDIAPAMVLAECQMEAGEALRLQAAMGYGLEDMQMIVEAMAQTAAEPTYCMGDDTPLPVLASMPHMLYDYFKQRFAQVTNPPIDPLREGLVMSLEMRLGKRGNLLEPGSGAYHQVMLKSPVLLESELEAVLADSALPSATFQLRYKAGRPTAMREALAALCADVEAAVRGGATLVVLSDRLPAGLAMELDAPPIPTLLAVGAVHHHLIRAGLRTDTSIVADTAQCFSTHHVAMLVGYGAHAVCPYLGFESCRQWRAAPRTEALIKAGKVADVSMEEATLFFKKALEKGLLKILSKMGISLLSCYHGAQIFEVYGLGKEVIEAAFAGTVSRVGGLNLDDIQREVEAFWAKGFPGKALTKLDDYGYIQSRPKGEYHANNQAMAKLLHKAIGLGGQGAAGQGAYDAYTSHFKAAPVHVLRDMLELRSGRAPVPVEEVEPAADVMARFCTGGMSLGAISRETHETIAIAMNRIGGKSNSGEGGEDPVRWERITDVDARGKSDTLPHLRGLRNGDIATSRIKQVASGRFGVTPEFLVNAEQLEIKVAQGAKPGEGGQLPGKKVSPYIAGMRRSKPGVPLISPPPHHDIYSIEDLAQLIYDLHQVNPAAKVSVKLVAQAGIGTVASGVAKANADIIQISGHDGGTGASPVSSIKHCGGPVEMGLAEVHQTLTANGLRERVILRADGGMRTGRDVLVMAAVGSDEYGFGTVAMIATGCIMARVCHTNNCPVGVASQREELRARFPGAPEDLVNYFAFVAEEVRAGLAALGFRSLNELIGRADVLKQRSAPLPKTSGLDLSFLTTYAGETGTSASRLAQPTHDNGPQLDDRILADADAAIANQGTVCREYEIVNVDRSALGRVGGAIARSYGDSGFSGRVELLLQGSAGQSFACFMVEGMVVRLVGEANDYVGKGMAGGEVTIVPPPGEVVRHPEGRGERPGTPAAGASIAGNTCLYGATGGRLFLGGRAGERFAVRNSRAEAVVEGAGDHCCEYMTGGAVVSLGPVGRNVAAGMTGGLGYFYDEEGDFPDKVNAEIVAIQRLQTAAGEHHLRALIEAHVERTGSAKGKAILAGECCCVRLPAHHAHLRIDWAAAKYRFWQLVPPSEANTPKASLRAEQAAQQAGAAPAMATSAA